MNFFVVGGPDGGSRIHMIQDGWLYFAITLPLTFLTVLAWLLWGRPREDNHSITSLHDVYRKKVGNVLHDAPASLPGLDSATLSA